MKQASSITRRMAFLAGTAAVTLSGASLAVAQEARPVNCRFLGFRGTGEAVSVLAVNAVGKSSRVRPKTARHSVAIFVISVPNVWRNW